MTTAKSNMNKPIFQSFSVSQAFSTTSSEAWSVVSPPSFYGDAGAPPAAPKISAGFVKDQEASLSEYVKKVVKNGISVCAVCGLIEGSISEACCNKNRVWVNKDLLKTEDGRITKATLVSHQ